MKHPEQNDDEVFVINIFKEKAFKDIGWKTKRKGITAFTIDGTPLNFGYPIFVKREEILEAMKQVKDKTVKKVFKKMLEQ